MNCQSLFRAWLRGWLCLLGSRDPLAGLGWPARTRIRSRALLQLGREPSGRIGLLLLCLLLLLARSLAWRIDLAGFWRDAWLLAPFLLLAPCLFLRQRLHILRLLRADPRVVTRPPVRCSNSPREDLNQTYYRPGRAGHCPGPRRHHFRTAVCRSERLSGRD